jgi:hypothetical protein
VNATDSNARATGDVHTKLESLFDLYISNGIHIFLSFLAAVVFVAAIIAAFDLIVRDFPKLWHPANEYDVLHSVLRLREPLSRRLSSLSQDLIPLFPQPVLEFSKPASTFFAVARSTFCRGSFLVFWPFNNDFFFVGL